MSAQQVADAFEAVFKVATTAPVARPLPVALDLKADRTTLELVTEHTKQRVARVAALHALGIKDPVGMWPASNLPPVRPAHPVIVPSVAFEVALNRLVRVAVTSTEAFESARDLMTAWRTSARPDLTLLDVMIEHKAQELTKAKHNLTVAEAKLKGQRVKNSALHDTLRAMRAEAAAVLAEARTPATETAEAAGMRLPPLQKGAKAHNRSVGVADYAFNYFFDTVQKVQRETRSPLKWSCSFPCTAGLGPCLLDRPVEPEGRDRGTAVRCTSAPNGPVHYAHLMCLDKALRPGADRDALLWACGRCFARLSIAQERCRPAGVAHPIMHTRAQLLRSQPA